MKRVLVLLAPLALLLGWLWMHNYGDGPVRDTPPSEAPAPDEVARGAYLARAGNCMACHTARGGPAYAGGRALVTPFGTLYSSNLTPDAETGLGSWSRGHFWRALHHGRSRDGRLLYPAFPYTHYTRVSRADADALFDYLRSLPPVHQPQPAHELRWPYRTQAALAVWRALYFRRGQPLDEPAQTAEWNRGAYLVQGLGHCGACHTARNALGAGKLLDLSGGLMPMQDWYAPSLASLSEAGVGAWPLEDIIQLMGTGVAPRATAMGPMAEVVLHSTQYLEAEDLRAMAVYLKSLPPAPGAAELDPRVVQAPPTPVREQGARIYERHCASCHGAAGEGVPGAYPPLAANRAVMLPVAHNLVQAVLYGGYPPATQGNPRPFGMPPYALVLSDAEVAAVLSYIRSSWGNRAAPVSELDVSRLRRSTQ